MVQQCLRTIGQHRYMRAAVGVRIYGVSTKKARINLCIAITFSVIVLLVCGAYGGTQGYTIGHNVVKIWEIKHHQPMAHKQSVVNIFTAFYIQLMATGGMGAVSYIMFLLTKRHPIHLSYLNLRGEKKRLTRNDLLERFWLLTVVCVTGGVVVGLATFFGMSSFIDFITD